MKILIVCSKTRNRIGSFITEQAESLIKAGVIIDYYTIEKRGILGYLMSFPKLNRKIKLFKPDIIHAHYGFSGLLANFQRKIPVVTTFHGTDINDHKAFYFSKLAMILSKYNIFVSSKLIERARPKKNHTMISCGIDFNNFKEIDRDLARIKLGLSLEKKYLLFSSSFDNKVKNYELARDSLQVLSAKGIEIELLEFKGYNREKSNLLFNAVDGVLVTSKSESGPLVIKEAMAVNTPAISVDVGDVSEITNNTKGYFITSHDKDEISNAILDCLKLNKRTNGRNKIQFLDIDIVAQRIIEVYKKIIS